MEYEVEEKYKIRFTSKNNKTRNYEATLLYIGTQADCEAYAKQPVVYKSRNKTINKQVNKDRNAKDLEIDFLKDSLNEHKKKVSAHEAKIKELEEENQKLKQLASKIISLKAFIESTLYYLLRFILWSSYKWKVKQSKWFGAIHNSRVHRQWYTV